MRYDEPVLELAVLGLLKEQQMHGYELKKQLSDVFGMPGAVSFGSLYPALARLEAAGAVRAVESGQGDSRRRKVYAITPAGASMFDALLATSQGTVEDERGFNLRLAFARYLPPEARLGMLEQRRAVLGERLAQLAARARARRDDRYVRVLAERQREALARDVSWLEGLIREERSGADRGRAAGPGHAFSADTGPARSVPLASASQLQRPPAGGPGAHRPRNDPPAPLHNDPPATQ